MGFAINIECIMNVQKFLFSLSLVMLSQSVIATNWVFSPASSTDSKETTYIDYDSITGYFFNNYDKTNFYVTAWVRKDYPTAQKLNNGKLFHQEKSFWYVDCLNSKIDVGDTIWQMNNGKLVGSSKGYVMTYSSDNWQRVVPDSIGQATAQSICSYYNIKMYPKQTNES